ncbi:MAG: bifunctional hydroxymethylpyrimidine kinase/phosphomethylpyrimidine kinase [Bacteroidales bacterium]|nr:bifunctional hydroxymethylpyrimidine kinase/phosphomethylpyrimidine kinase [Bacteroidales bacterium]
MQRKHYTRVLTIAGSDSGGGAGVQADIKTISALGCYAASAITAVTVQNTMGVSDVHPIPADIVEGQIRAVLDDIGADAIKIGMLQSREITRRIAAVLGEYPIRNIVLDPVMVSTSGHRLIEPEAVEALVSCLMPLARVITPNIPEAEILLGGKRLSDQASLSEAAVELSRLTGASVLLKAGHLAPEPDGAESRAGCRAESEAECRAESECLSGAESGAKSGADRGAKSGAEPGTMVLTDYFYDAERGELIELPSQAVQTVNTHGTGCTMSSALAAYLAKGCSLQDAARGAKAYIAGAIADGAAYEIGHGHGPVNHFFLNKK